MVGHATFLFKEGGLPDDKSMEIDQSIAANWGGSIVYFKKTFALTARDKEIYDKYNGRNRDQLCREYDISVQWFYQIVRTARTHDIAKRQPDIFDHQGTNNE